MYENLVIGKQIVNIVSDYALQLGLSVEENVGPWDCFIIVLSIIANQDSIFIGSDLNGYLGRYADGYGAMFNTRLAF